ncbi:uncharacterized protein LOC129588898 [Paramacrobiotus metropolitanus]|uniref:uncharacterized protein LOC129588898 n=1 Tax=Paramacrobiotus metropolitanus TaxID=2943436 RepID=UPI00244623B0|nr:uncharacterized protein LOC129588898 [Paramacrobiotus metropolitanus]
MHGGVGRLYTLFVPWFGDTSMNLSDWILVVFSWERLLVVMSPFRFEFLQCVLTARLVIIFLVVLSLASFVFDFVHHYFPYMHDFSRPVDDTPQWFLPWLKINKMGLIGMRVLTFLLILIPSVILIAFLARYRRSEFGTMRRLQKSNSAATSTSNSSAQHGINIILLSSALLYLITRAPKFFDLCASLLVWYGVRLTYNDDYTLNNLMEPIIHVTTFMGYSLNFYLYLLTERHILPT